MENKATPLFWGGVRHNQSCSIAGNSVFAELAETMTLSFLAGQKSHEVKMMDGVQNVHRGVDQVKEYRGKVKYKAECVG